MELATLGVVDMEAVSREANTNGRPLREQNVRGIIVVGTSPVCRKLYHWLLDGIASVRARDGIERFESDHEYARHESACLDLIHYLLAFCLAAFDGFCRGVLAKIESRCTITHLRLCVTAEPSLARQRIFHCVQQLSKSMPFQLR